MNSSNTMEILAFNIKHVIMIPHFMRSHTFDELVRWHEMVSIFPEKGHRCVSINVSAFDQPYDERLVHFSVGVEKSHTGRIGQV